MLRVLLPELPIAGLGRQVLRQIKQVTPRSSHTVG